MSTVKDYLPSSDLIAVGVLGSISFFDTTGKSEAICKGIGQQIQNRPKFVCVQGGLSGVAETTAKAISDAERVYSVLPIPSVRNSFGHGKVLGRGYDMEERRTELAKMCDIYFMIEGGPGTVDEAEKVLKYNSDAVLLPMSITGGASSGMFFPNSDNFFQQVNARIQDRAPTVADKLIAAYKSSFDSLNELESLFNLFESIYQAKR